MLYTSFTFDDVRSEKMGIYAELISAPLRSEPKTVYTDIAGRDGELNLSITNPKKRLIYKPRIIEFLCHYVISDPFHLFEELSDLSGYLFKDGDRCLSIGENTSVCFKAHVANLFNTTFETEDTVSFPLIFKCDPFIYDKEPSVFTGENTLDLHNDGYFTNGIINVSGYAPNGFSLSSDRYPHRILYVDTPVDNTTVSIDTENMNVTIGGVSYLSSCRGDFFEFAPGDNLLTISGEEADVGLEVIFHTRHV